MAGKHFEMGDPVSTGKANVTVLGGYFNGEVFTLPVDTKAIKLQYAEGMDPVVHVIVRGDDGHRYALHPLTGTVLMEEMNQDAKRSHANDR